MQQAVLDDSSCWLWWWELRVVASWDPASLCNQNILCAQGPLMCRQQRRGGLQWRCFVYQACDTARRQAADSVVFMCCVQGAEAPQPCGSYCCGQQGIHPERVSQEQQDMAEDKGRTQNYPGIILRAACGISCSACAASA